MAHTHSSFKSLQIHTWNTNIMLMISTNLNDIHSAKHWGKDFQFHFKASVVMATFGHIIFSTDTDFAKVVSFSKSYFFPNHIQFEKNLQMWAREKPTAMKSTFKLELLHLIILHS